MTDPLFPLTAFHLPPNDANGKPVTHVCAAGETLPLRSHQDAFTTYLHDKSSGHVSHAAKSAHVDSARTLLAKSWNVSKAEIGFSANVADGVSLLLESLTWAEGDNVVLDPDDFPSLIAPFAVMSQSNLEKAGKAVPEVRYAGEEHLESVVDGRTRLIAISYVSYLNGARVDLLRYRAVADSVGAILVVDYSQAAGYMAIDARIADFAFSAVHKWLLSVTGVAVAFWNKARQPDWRPATAGWASLEIGHPRPRWGEEKLVFRDDAMVFMRGNPGHLAVYVLKESLEFLERWDVRVVEGHVLGLTGRLLEGLEREGIVSSTPRERERRAGSVTVHCEGAAEIVDGLRERGVYAWNGNGRVRISSHGYNCERDVERVLDEFPRLWRRYNA
ncbi:pyridoxal phosphate-dependent transferase [Aspergillus karnatakaensis]|uniref:pyridoxal phosphate-dependent transferase n=1 Tax=Aspergillus karnatakaensis TaxID=1810916 RepID=UPI003CCE0800